LDCGSKPCFSDASSLGEVPLLNDQPPMATQKRIRKDRGVEFEPSLLPYGLALRARNTVSVGEPDSLSAKPLLEQSIFCLEELNDD
jgi:hypothetical protein